MVDQQSPAQKLGAAALAVMLAAAPMAPLVMAPDAAMAARSGGRVGGGGSFRSAPRPSARPSAPRQAAAPRVTNNNYYRGGGGGVMVAPMPMISPFGYSPFGGFGTGYAAGAILSGGGGGVGRQEAYRMENQLGQEEGKIQALEKQLEESKALNEKLESRMDALEAK